MIPFKYINIRIRTNLILVLILFYSLSAAQNLVPNPSFESFNIACSNIIPGGGGLVNWYSPISHSQFSYTYCNVCSINTCCRVPYNANGKNYQEAHSGVAYVALPFYVKPNNSIGLRGYLQVKLINPLIINKCYYIVYYVSRMEFYKLVNNNLSLLVGNTAVYSDSNNYIPAIPQIQQYGNPIITDTLNWVKIGGIYTANGGEQYITIGNFADDAHTDTLHFPTPGVLSESAYFIDDVSVIPLDSMFLQADAGRDTTIVKGDSIWVGSRLCGLQNVVWYDAYNNVIDTGVPGLWVKPKRNTFYIIEQNVCGQYSRDTVYVGVQALPVSMLNFECLMLNERQAKVIWETAMEINVSHFNVQRSIDGINFYTIGKVNAKGAGTYTFNDQSPLWGGLL